MKNDKGGIVIVGRSIGTILVEHDLSGVLHKADIFFVESLFQSHLFLELLFYIPRLSKYFLVVRSFGSIFLFNQHCSCQTLTLKITYPIQYLHPHAFCCVTGCANWRPVSHAEVVASDI